MPEFVPPEIVDMIIDDVGGGRGLVHRPPLKEGRDRKADTISNETLRSCALVARSWTYRSRMNLFKEIVYTVDGEEGILGLPLPTSDALRFVKFLEIYIAPANPNRGPITLHLLSAFSLSPLEFLQIDGGLFSFTGRTLILACFSTLSGLLLTIDFRFCLFDPEPLRDILSISDTKANIMFLGCDQDHPEDPSREVINWEPVYHHPDRTLCVMGGEGKPSEEFLVDLSLLDVNFCRLEVDFYEDGEWVDATQSLIDACAGALLFLKLNVISSTSDDLPEDAAALAPPNLDLCVNLSEFVLNMKGSYSCAIQTPSVIFYTLLKANCHSLFKITLEVEDSRVLFLPEFRREYLDCWKHLDAILTMLAEGVMDGRGRKLIFVMEIMCRDDTVHRAKKWLPRLLEMFSREGSLHAHDGEDDVCDGSDHDVTDEKACMGRAVLKKYVYESESDEKTEEEGDTTEGGGENTENKEAEVVEGGKVEDVDGGDKGDGEGRGEN